MKPLQSPLFWLAAAAAVAVLVVIGVGVPAAIKYARRSPPGFLDYVKNPEMWQEMEKESAVDESDIEEAQHWNDQQIESAVRRFVFEKGSGLDAWKETAVLQSLGSKTHPVLSKLLSDKANRAKFLATSKTNFMSESPFQRICNLLGRNPAPEAVSMLAPYLDEESEAVRKEAAIVIASVGTDSVIPLVRKTLRDPDEYVRSYALMGLKRAREGNRLSKACRQELFPDIQALLSEGKNGDDAASLLLECDQSKATEFFLSEGMFIPKSRALQDILQAFNAKGITVPRDRLLGLIEQLASLPPKYPREYQLCEALHALGKHQIAEDRAALERYLSDPDETVASGAVAGMIASHGLDGFEDRIWKAKSPSALTLSQRYYSAVMEFDGEVRNGGFSQYFFNSSGDEWKAALAGLQEIGSKERLTIVRDALSKFDQASPSESRNQRMEQLAKIENEKESVFNELDTRYYKCAENLEVLMMRYVLKNPEAFR